MRLLRFSRGPCLILLLSAFELDSIDASSFGFLSAAIQEKALLFHSILDWFVLCSLYPVHSLPPLSWFWVRHFGCPNLLVLI